jgi:lipooligosaccharide transport system permease protein
MFLFSTTFYPLAAYPHAAQFALACTPLYNGVALLRSLTLGGVGWTTAGHVLYLAALGTAGVAVAGRRLERKLIR